MIVTTTLIILNHSKSIEGVPPSQDKVKQLELVEDLDVSDEFVLIPSKTSMKKVIKLLAENPNSAMLVQDPKSGKIIGAVDNEDVQRFEADGQKVKKGNVDKWMGTNILEIIDKTPLARLPQLLPERQPDAVIVNDVTGKFKGFLSPADYKLASGDNSSQPEVTTPPPPKPKRGPPKSSKNMKVESHSIPPPQQQEEAPKLIIEEIHEDDQISEVDAFFDRVRGRSTGAFNDPHGELAQEAWNEAGGGDDSTPTMMHPLGTADSEASPEGQGMTQVLMKTSAGDILLQMYDDRAPDTVANFLKLVDMGHYDGLHFHRVIEQFMLQGGCPHSRDPRSSRAGTGDAGWKIPCERGALAISHNKPGLLSMANAGPNTGGSQFFLTTIECQWLDGKHAVFGEVVSGMDVVKAIENCPKGAGDKPVQPQQMITVARA